MCIVDCDKNKFRSTPLGIGFFFVLHIIKVDLFFFLWVIGISGVSKKTPKKVQDLG
jgi:hypothetical protein